jgi:putative membrane protein insertion efficiency factor
MSALRKSLKSPRTWLAALAALLVFALLDTCRDPADQVTARIYIGGVRVYQVCGRPLLTGKVRCRYHPSCSDYSIEAVRKHGLRHGLVLSIKRISACQSDVPFDTPDPVPDPER